MAGGVVDTCDEVRRGGMGGGAPSEVTALERPPEVVRRGSAGATGAECRGSGTAGALGGEGAKDEMGLPV